MTTTLDSIAPAAPADPDMALLRDAKLLVANNRGVLYGGSIAILKHGIMLAETKGDFSDLREYVPKFTEKHAHMKVQLEEEQRQQAIRHRQDIHLHHHDKTLKQLYAELARLEAESLVIRERHARLRPGERTQRRAHVLNREEAIAKAKVLLWDAIDLKKKGESP
ncbi:MAG: hypothetical protein GYA24_05160 [Candidatus Lokiarchaeota archaeon]|nr:hypothetical protein [Candidatus Lokiarchaeota archaeon]